MSVTWASNGRAARRKRLTLGALCAIVLLSVVLVFSSWGELPRLSDGLGSASYNRYRAWIMRLGEATADETDKAESSLRVQGADPIERPSSPSAQLIDKTVQTVTQWATATATAKTTPPAACTDPYRQPGFLFIDPTHDYNHTRYVPYTDDFLDAEPPASAQYPYDVKADGELWFDEASRVDQSWLEQASTPTQWLNMALDEARDITQQNRTLSDKLAWLNGRVVLAISDSIDRRNMEFFCNEFEKRKADPGATWQAAKRIHGYGVCHVPSINFTLVHWHLPGMITHYPGWWWDAGNVDIVPFEERWDSVWNNTWAATVGINGRGPDLVLWQTALWERKFYRFAAKEHYIGNTSKLNMTRYERPLVWSEVRFHAARVRVLLQMIRDRLGAQVPVMLRSVTIDRDLPAKDVQLYEFDRINRAMNGKFGNEVFEWGKIVTGHTDLYLDQKHLNQGPSSWLWGTMVLEYVARAVGVGQAGGARVERAPYFDGWESCHRWLV